MDRFLLKRKSANEAEVEEVHVEENLAAPTTKRNNVRVFKFNPEPAIELWMDDAKKPRRLVAQEKITDSRFCIFLGI